MKTLNKIIILIAICIIQLPSQAQQPANTRMQNLFFQYLEQKLSFNQMESRQVKPIANAYMNEIRSVNRTIIDPLEQQQERVRVKIKYRNLLSPIIGLQRANRFFTEEQAFRKQVREELKARKTTYGSK